MTKPRQKHAKRGEIIAVKNNATLLYKASKLKPPIQGKIFHVCGQMRNIYPNRKSQFFEYELIYVGKWCFFRFELEKHGYVVRDGAFVNATVCKQTPKTDRLVIIERLYDDDLRTLSDMRAKPAWRKLPWLVPAIDAIYAERDRITKETGIEHEVDHIHPVNHSRLCGLTVPWNLQVISAVENRRKSNRIID